MLYLQRGPQRRYVNARPYSDWIADVQRRLEHRTGNALALNDAPDNYWQALYHCGEGAWNAADEYLSDRR